MEKELFRKIKPVKFGLLTSLSLLSMVALSNVEVQAQEVFSTSENQPNAGDALGNSYGSSSTITLGAAGATTNEVGSTANPTVPVTNTQDEETPVENYGPLPTEDQLKYHKEELAAFIHFGMNTFTNAEWGNGRENPQDFNPTELDTDQWISELKNAGFKRTIMVVKHHDGFVLYPSEHTTHDVASSPWKDGKGDVLAEISKSATKYDMDLGVYLSPWDAHHPKYSVATQDEYNKYYLDQLKEILGNEKYGNKGKFVEVWMDGARGSGAQRVTYTFDEWFKYIREQEGDITIFSARPTSVRWIGNERGIAGDPVWHKVKKAEIKEGVSHGYLNHGDPEGDMYSVGEADVSIRPGWFYHDNQQPKSIKDLMNIYFKSVGRGTPLLLNIPPDRRGKFADADVERLREFKATLADLYSVDHSKGATITASSTRKNKLYSVDNLKDDNDETSWAPANGATTGTLTIDLGEKKTFDVIELKEQISKGQRVSGFNVEVELNGKWVKYAEGHTVGYRRLLQGQPITAQKIRVNITGAQATPLISNFAVYKTPKTIELTDGFPLNMKYVSNTEAAKEKTWHAENEGIRGTSMWTNTDQASATYTFTGTKAYIVSTVDPNHGVMEVYVDGTKVGEANTQSSPRKRSQLVFETPELADGEHTVKLVRKTRAIATEGIYVVDNEAAGMFELAKSEVVTEKGKALNLTVKRVAGSKGAASIKVITEPGTGVHGKVYTDTVEVLNFAEGETSKTVTVPLIDYVGNESFDFKVKLLEPSGKTFIGMKGETVVRTVAAEDLPEVGQTYDDQDSKIVYHGNWNNGSGSYKGTEKWLNFPRTQGEAKQDISYDLYFIGSGISTFGALDPGHGYLEVFVDGVPREFSDGEGNSTEKDGKKHFSAIGSQRKGGVELVKLRGLDPEKLHVLTVRLDPKANDINGRAGMQIDKVSVVGEDAQLLSKAEVVAFYTDIKNGLAKKAEDITDASKKEAITNKLAAVETKLAEKHIPLAEVETLIRDVVELQKQAAPNNTGAQTAPEKPKEVTPAPEKPKEATPAPEKPKEVTPAPEKPKEATPAPEKPKEATPAPEKPKETTPAPEKPKEATPAPEKPKETTPAPGKVEETKPEVAKEATPKHEHKVLDENLTQPALPTYDLEADYDGDGYSNYIELVLGSNPNEKESLPTPKVALKTPMSQLGDSVTEKSTAKSDDVTDEKSLAKVESTVPEKSVAKVETLTETPENVKEMSATLPATGETDAYLIFGAAAMAILAGIGLLPKRKEINE